MASVAASPSDPKAVLRTELQARRGAFMGQARDRADAAIQARVQEWLSERNPLCVAGYIAMAGEADILPVLAGSSAAGCQACLPAILDENAPLIFKQWTPSDHLEQGPHGTQAAW